ncbi:CAP domain-containing protein [Streptomyces sp. NPDC091292]|uniref:CAP domain-containing protein n=1 Tax=Streptomyces sp. NPDC091292 TaxID=3365991 RepID=UPI00381DBCEA
MRKHRRKPRYRRTTVAAITLGALAIPSAAMACLADRSGPESGTLAASTGTRTAPYEQGTATSAGSRAEPSGLRTAASYDRPKSESHGREKRKEHAPTEKRRGHGKRTPPPAGTTAPAPVTTTPSTPAAPSSPSSTPAQPSQPAVSPASGAPASAAPASAAVARVVALVNSERGKAGCSPLTLNAKLAKAAQDHSADMASNRNMSHTGSDGSDPGERITRAGYSWSTYGENVAYGYSTPEQVMDGWMSSPGHKRNILTCDFKEIGVGLAQPGGYWTQDFGTAR